MREWGCVEGEEERGEDRALWDSCQQGGRLGGEVGDLGRLSAIGEEGRKKGEGGAGESKVDREPGEEDGVVDGIKGCGEVEKDEGGDFLLIRGT